MHKHIPDPALEALEQYLESNVLQAKMLGDGMLVQPTEQKVHAAEEKWVQKYVKRHYRRLGFAGIDGPFKKGPDFRVRKELRWVWAKVETKWQHYCEHGPKTLPDMVQSRCFESADERSAHFLNCGLYAEPLARCMR